MTRPLGVLRGAVIAIRERLSVAACQSERTVMLGTILLASAVSAAMGYVLTQCYSVDVLVLSCCPSPRTAGSIGACNIGRHCFSDYAMVVDAGMRPNPWEPYPMLLPPDYQPSAPRVPGGWQ